MKDFNPSILIVLLVLVLSALHFQEQDRLKNSPMYQPYQNNEQQP